MVARGLSERGGNKLGSAVYREEHRLYACYEKYALLARGYLDLHQVYVSESTSRRRAHKYLELERGLITKARRFNVTVLWVYDFSQ